MNEFVDASGDDGDDGGEEEKKTEREGGGKGQGKETKKIERDQRTVLVRFGSPPVVPLLSLPVCQREKGEREPREGQPEFTRLVCSSGLLVRSARLVRSSGLLVWSARPVCSSGLLVRSARPVCSSDQ